MNNFTNNIFELKKCENKVKQTPNGRIVYADYMKESGVSGAFDEIVLVKEEKTTYFINTIEVVFIEKDLNNAKIHTLDKVYVTKMTLQEFEVKLPNYFMRTHKSYIVNLKKIEKANVFTETSFCLSFRGLKQTALITKEKLKAVMKALK